MKTLRLIILCIALTAMPLCSSLWWKRHQLFFVWLLFTSSGGIFVWHHRDPSTGHNVVQRWFRSVRHSPLRVLGRGWPLHPRPERGQTHWRRRHQSARNQSCRRGILTGHARRAGWVCHPAALLKWGCGREVESWSWPEWVVRKTKQSFRIKWPADSYVNVDVMNKDWSLLSIFTIKSIVILGRSLSNSIK